MNDDCASDVTLLLRLASQGDQEAAAKVFPMIRDTLRAIAEMRFRNEPTGHTLQPTVLVHDAFLKLLGENPGEWKDRGQFFAFASRAIRGMLTWPAPRKLIQSL